MYRGRSEHNIDAKGRLSIPSRFNPADEGLFIVTNFGSCLSGYPLREWEKLEEKLANLPQFDKNVVAFQRYFVASASECTLDKQGRILIPPGLREGAGLEKECVVLGRLNKFEIWSKERWQQEFSNIEQSFDAITGDLSQMGIPL